MATMIWPLRRATQVAAERVAVRCGPVRLTYGETWDRGRRLVGGLRRLGMGAGDRVAVVGPNCHRHLEIYQAVPGAGMVLVPLNQRHTAAELRYSLDCPPGVDLPGIELAEIARGFGCPGSRVDTAEQFEAALRSSLAGGGPTLLDVGVDLAVESLY
jgi:hypothetical protein